MALTQEQIEQMNTIVSGVTGGSKSNPLAPKGNIQDAIAQFKSGQTKESFVKDLGSDLRQAGQEISQSFQRRGMAVQEAKTASDMGEQSQVRGIAQGLGETAGFLADTIGTAFKTIVKAPLSQETETKLKQKAGEVVSSLAETPGGQDIKFVADSFKNWYENELTPEQQRDVDAFGGVTALATELVGVGTGKRAAKAGLETVEQGVKRVDDVVSSTFRRTPEEIDSVVANTTKQTVDNGNLFIETAKELKKSFSPSKLADRQIAKSFKLAPSDVTDIENRIGGSMSDWLVANNLVKASADQSMDAINKFKLENYNLVRDAIGSVDETFSFNDVPELRNLVDDLIQKTEVGQSEKYVNLNNQLKQAANKFNRGEATLSDAQFVKSAFDDIESIFKRSKQEVKEGVKFADLAESRSQVQQFIENIVSEKLPNVNIKELNRNVSVSKTLVDDIIERAGKFDTQSAIGLGDYFVFGLGQQAIPGAGVAAFAGKKIVESSPVRMAITRFINKNPQVKATDLETMKKEIADAINAQFENEFRLPPTQ